MFDAISQDVLSDVVGGNPEVETHCSFIEGIKFRYGREELKRNPGHPTAEEEVALGARMSAWEQRCRDAGNAIMATRKFTIDQIKPALNALP